MSNITEHELTRAMHETVDGLEAPIDRIVAGALADGRRLRGIVRRRRALRTTTAVSGLAAAATIGAFVLGSTTSGSRGGSGNDPAVQPADTAVPVTHAFGVDADKVAVTLSKLLPAGSTSDLTNIQSSSAPSLASIKLAGGGALNSMESGADSDWPYRGGRLTFDDGHGAAQIDVMIQAPDKNAKPSLATIDISSALCHSSGVTCADVKGGVLVTKTNIAEYGGSRSAHAAGNGVESSSAVYQTAGWEVTVTAYNATAEKGGTVTRATPPLTADQLNAIATYPGWLK